MSGWLQRYGNSVNAGFVFSLSAPQVRALLEMARGLNPDGLVVGFVSKHTIQYGLLEALIDKGLFERFVAEPERFAPERLAVVQKFPNDIRITPAGEHALALVRMAAESQKSLELPKESAA